MARKTRKKSHTFKNVLGALQNTLKNMRVQCTLIKEEKCIICTITMTETNSSETILSRIKPLVDKSGLKMSRKGIHDTVMVLQLSTI